MKKLLLLLLLVFGGISPLKADTVICIHGFLMSFRTMIPIGKSLKCPGFDVRLWNYPTRSHTAREHGAELVKILQHVAAEKPGEPIHFVSHSLGSWIVRAALGHPGCPQEARCGKAVLIAPPNQGIWLARHFRGVFPFCWVLGDQIGWEMSNYCAEDVEALGSFPPEMKVLIIAGNLGTHLWFKGRPNDGYVLVEETYLHTPATHYVLPIRHGTLPRDPATIRLIVDFLVNK